MNSHYSIELADRLNAGCQCVSLDRAGMMQRIGFMLEGGKGSIECTFRYRTRSEFGVFIDKLMEAARPI